MPIVRRSPPEAGGVEPSPPPARTVEAVRTRLRRVIQESRKFCRAVLRQEAVRIVIVGQRQHPATEGGEQFFIQPRRRLLPGVVAVEQERHALDAVLAEQARFPRR